jgi:hypothetical protein
MAVPKVIRRQVKRVRAFVKEFFLEFLVDVFHFLVHGTTNYLYEKTLPFTTKYLSRWADMNLVHACKCNLVLTSCKRTPLCRVPKPPNVTVKDVRANRVSLALCLCRPADGDTGGNGNCGLCHCCVPLQIRLNIDSSYSSPFNIEQFEIEWTSADSDIWVNIGWVT